MVNTLEGLGDKMETLFIYGFTLLYMLKPSLIHRHIRLTGVTLNP